MGRDKFAVNRKRRAAAYSSSNHLAVDAAVQQGDRAKKAVVLISYSRWLHLVVMRRNDSKYKNIN
ncbi:MAG TPA: hypothetical protein VN153_09875 [Tahibacter sp.]|nr:hypothetical protein [Tahibacter sp.]